MDYATKILNNSISTTITNDTPNPLKKNINSVEKKLLGKTSETIISTNTTEQYSIFATKEIGLNLSDNKIYDYSLSSIQSLREEQTTTRTVPVATTKTTITTTTISTFPTQTVATYIINNKRPTIIIYPTVSPESIVIPIVSCIFGFPILALLVICCLRRRAKLARERDRRRNYDMQDHAVSLVRFSPIHRLNCRSSRPVSLRPERSLSRGFPSLELDTVLEERSDVEQTQTEMITADSPLDSTSFKASFSS